MHSLNSLFDQLGLESTKDCIETFIEKNQPLPRNVQLHEADIWNLSQANFLQKAKELDADWSAVVDRLDVLLR